MNKCFFCIFWVRCMHNKSDYWCISQPAWSPITEGVNLPRNNLLVLDDQAWKGLPVLSICTNRYTLSSDQILLNNWKWLPVRDKMIRHSWGIYFIKFIIVNISGQCYLRCPELTSLIYCGIRMTPQDTLDMHENGR